MKKIETNQAPAAIGPYSQAVIAGNTMYLSGQIPIDPATGNLVEAKIEVQTRQVFENIKAVLAAAQLTMKDIVSVTVLLTDMNDFAVVNEIYAEYFEEPYPARAAYAVKALPKGSMIEIATIAVTA